MKYHNRKITVDGKTFDSRKEYRRYNELVLLERAGVISALETQKEFELIPAQYETIERYSKTGRRLQDKVNLVERKVEYVADFVYNDAKTGELVVEDTKGVRTKDYIIKRKLMYAVYSIKIREV